MDLRTLLWMAVTLWASTGMAWAEQGDPALVERLEAAQEQRDKTLAMNALSKRMRESPALPDALIVRALRKAASDEYLSSYRLDGMLRSLGPSVAQRDDVVIVLSHGLASQGILRGPDGNGLVAPTLTEYQRGHPLPGPAYASLIAALDNRAMSNREIALSVLAAMPPTDARYAATVELIAETLSGHDHQSTRSAAVVALATMAGKQALSPGALSALEHAATGDPYMTVRMDALEALSAQPMTAARRDTLARSLTTELLERDQELWQRSRGLRAHQGLESRAEALLDDWYAPSYPAHVADAFIALSADGRLDRSPAIVREIRDRGELTREQRQSLIEIAKGTSTVQVRARTYAVLGEIQDDQDVAAAVQALHARSPVALRAAYGLLARFDRGAVPAPVAAAANAVMLQTGDKELRATVAQLVARGSGDREQVERELIAGVRRVNGSASGIAQSLFALYGDAGVESMVSRYVTDPTLSPLFRSGLVRRLEKTADPHEPLRAETVAALVEAGRTSRDYWLLGAIARVHDARGLSLPLALYLKQRKTHYLALSLAWIACAVLCLGVGVFSVFRIFTPSSVRRRGKSATAGLFIVWLLLALAAAVAALIGVVSSLGHNSSPSPGSVLVGNVPFYVITLVHVVFAGLLRARRREYRGAGDAGDLDAVSP